MPSMMDLLSQLGGHEAAREAMKRQAYQGAGGSFEDRLREVGNPSPAFIEDRRFGPRHFDPQTTQQLEAIEGVVGPLMDQDREWIAEGLLSGSMTLGQAIEQLKTARTDWRP